MFRVFIEKLWRTLFKIDNMIFCSFFPDCGLLFQDFQKLNERVNALEEIERKRVNSSQVESTDNKPAAQSVNGEVKLYRNQSYKDSFEIFQTNVGKFVINPFKTNALIR